LESIRSVQNKLRAINGPGGIVHVLFIFPGKHMVTPSQLQRFYALVASGDQAAAILYAASWGLSPADFSQYVAAAYQQDFVGDEPRISTGAFNLTEQPKYLELGEAAEMLGVSVGELNDMRLRGEIRGIRDDSCWKFKFEEVDRVAEEFNVSRGMPCSAPGEGGDIASGKKEGQPIRGVPAAGPRYVDADPPPEGDGLCSDNSCPCPDVVIRHGQGYLYVDAETVRFRRKYPRLEDARRAAKQEFDLRARQLGAGGIRVVGFYRRLGGVLVCEQGARLRKLDLSVAAADAAHWWRTGQILLRPTPVHREAEGPNSQMDELDEDKFFDSLVKEVESRSAKKQSSHDSRLNPKTVSPEGHITVTCTCGARLRAKARLMGRTVSCPRCRNLVKIKGKLDEEDK